MISKHMVWILFYHHLWMKSMLLILSIIAFMELLFFLADNLAAHSVGGFKESFSFAKRICHSCMATIPMTQISYCEDDCDLHTPAVLSLKTYQDFQ